MTSVWNLVLPGSEFEEYYYRGDNRPVFFKTNGKYWRGTISKGWLRATSISKHRYLLSTFALRALWLLQS